MKQRRILHQRHTQQKCTLYSPIFTANNYEFELFMHAQKCLKKLTPKYYNEL